MILAPGRIEEPVAAAAEQHEPAPAQAESPVGDRCRVLLADANSADRYVAAEMLRALDCAVETADAPLDAVDMFTTSGGDFDIAILDFDAAELISFRAAWEIQRRSSTRKTYVVGVGIRDVRDAYGNHEALPVDDFVVKPFDAEKVTALLDRWEARHTAETSGASRIEPIHRFLKAALDRRGQRPAIPEPKTPKLLEAAGADDPSALYEICRATQTASPAPPDTEPHALEAPTTLDDLRIEMLRVRADMHRLASLFQSDRNAEFTAPSRLRAMDLPADSSIYAEFQGWSFLTWGLDARLSNQLSRITSLYGAEVSEVPKDGYGSARTDEKKLLVVRLAGDTDDLLEQCRQLRKGGLLMPILLIAERVDAKLLHSAADLEAELVLEPATLSELIVRSYRLVHRAAAKPEEPRTNRLLVAEDDPLTARFLTNSLRTGGFEVTHVSDGKAALDAIQESGFDAAILDINMPHVDGFGVLSGIRLNPARQSMGVLMLSARTKEQDKLRAFELGADDYVTKPFNPLELVARVQRLTKRGARLVLR
ncbi:MAG: response regulator [Bryobacteraceae bacterium]